MSKLVVLSVDALETCDLETLLRLPNMQRVKEKISVVKNIRSIYPTLTYPIHTTMITGKTPDEHGIYHNAISDPTMTDFNIMGENWYWEQKYIQCETLLDIAQKENKKVATFCWPVSAGDKRGINVPEIWPLRGDNSKTESLYREMCSQEGFDKYYDSHLQYFDWKNNEDMVTYLPELAIDCLRKEQPDLLLCHLILLDHIRHGFGNQNKIIDEVLRVMDVSIGRFIQATIDSGDFEDTNFVILGDHGQCDIERFFGINILFAQAGLVELSSEGLPVSYDAFAFSCGFSAQIVVKNPEVEGKVKDLLAKIQKDYPHLVERVYTKEEVLAEEGLSGRFSFMVEATEGTIFDFRYKGEVLVENDKSYYLATHGHHPEKGDKPTLIAFGKDVSAGFVEESGNMLDVYPTLLALSGLESKEQLKGRAMVFCRE